MKKEVIDMTCRDFKGTEEEFARLFSQWRAEIGYEVYYPFGEFDAVFGDMSVGEFVSKYGMVNLEEGDWFCIDDFGKFVRKDLYDIVNEAEKEDDFLDWLEARGE